MKPTNDIKIESGVELPNDLRRTWPIDKLKPGQSFEVPVDTGTLYRAAWYFRKTVHSNWKFTVRKTDKGARIWRVK